MSKRKIENEDRYLSDEEKTRFYFICVIMVILDILAIINFFRIFLY